MMNKDFEILSRVISEMLSGYIDNDATADLVLKNFGEWLDDAQKSDLISEINKISENGRENYIKTLLLNCWISSAIKCLENNE